MPGIVGIFAPAPAVAFEQQVRRMVGTMRHQPDSSSGTVAAPELGVYAGWVAHRDSFAQRQSFRRDGCELVFTGECYGPDIRPETLLVDQPDVRSDGWIAGLNGLFAGLLIDRDQGRATLFNDRYGSERLYAAQRGDVVYFASEAKALLAVLPELRAFDETGVAQYLGFGSTIGGHTLFRGVTLLPGGSLWRFGSDRVLRRGRHFESSAWEALPALSDHEFESRFAECFRSIVPDYLRADRPVGLSLTGGLDTRMIMACQPPELRPAVAYTYAAEGGDRLLDLTLARRLAGMHAIPHHALTVGPAFLADFAAQLDRTVRVTDGCAGVLGTHELYLSEQARRLAPIRLTGNFGSEVLRSMSTFKRNGPGDDLLDPGVAARVDRAVATEQGRKVHPVTHAAFEEVPWHLFGTLAAGRSQLSFRTPYLDNRLVELAYQAPAHMRHTASPALRLIRANDPALAGVPTDRGVVSGDPGLAGRLHRAYCSVTFKLDYWHKEGLPDALMPVDRLLGSLSHFGLLGLHKFLAYRRWFRGPLAPYAEQVTHDGRTRSLGFWNDDVLRSLAGEHASGKRNRLRDLHAVLTLEAVHRTLLDPAAYPDHETATA